MTFFFPVGRDYKNQRPVFIYTHRSTQCTCTRTPTTVKESLTAQIERLVQAFFNVAPSPDTSFVNVIINSGFAASRSCQNPSAQTLRTTPFCNCCQSLFHTGHWCLTPHPQQDLNPRAKRKGFSRQSNRSNRNRTNSTKNLSLHRIFCWQPPPIYKRKHLAWISLERDDQPGVWVVHYAELLGCLAFYKYLFSEQAWFMASLTLHYSITAVGDSDKAAAEPDHCRQEESQQCWRMKRPTCTKVRENTRSRMGSDTLKTSTSIGSGTLCSYSRPRSNTW